MNTNLILSTQVKGLPYFPELTGGKTTRVITKHFTNAAMHLPSIQFALLTWLIYQSKADNTFVYSTHLLNKFKDSYSAAIRLYSRIEKTIAIPRIRLNLKLLIESGYLLPNYDKKVFTINPMLSYRAEYMRSGNYKYICQKYSHIFDSERDGKYNQNDFTEHIKAFTGIYSEIVAGYMKKKIV